MPKIFIIDLFCGAGGLTTGASQVPGVEVIACVNHDDIAIESHKANHPHVLHFVEDVRNRQMIAALKLLVARLRREHPDCIIIIWASLECTNFSKAKGGLPRDADSRTLADCLDWYIEAIHPDGLWIENVEEFMAWGPLDANGKPLSRKAGTDYLRWIARIQAYGYQYDYRLLNAADFGAYTARKRFFGQFIRHGLPLAWPTPTHAKNAHQSMFGNLHQWKAVRDVLDFTDKGESIFTRKKPLSENTLKRIYAGLVKYVANGDEGFIKKYFSGKPSGKVTSLDAPSGTVCTIPQLALVQPEYIIQYNGGGHDQRTYALDRPITAISTNGRHAVVSPEFLISYYGNSQGAQSIDQPAGTVTTRDRMAAVWLDKSYSGADNHQPVTVPAGSVLTNDKHGLVQAFLVKNYSQGGQHNAIDGPAGSILTVPKENLVTCEGWLLNPQFASKGGSIDDPCFTLIARMDKKPPHLIQIEPGGQCLIAIYPEDSVTMRQIKIFMAIYGLSDIFMRMLRIPELKAIQGFPKNYILTGTQTQQKKHLGNAVEVTMGKSLIAAQAMRLTSSIKTQVA